VRRVSFSGQILTFLGVAAIYVGFTFVWAWYKGRQATNEMQSDGTTEYGGEH
jgi:hypothetical protein